MCGINGFNFKDQALISRMDALTSHRGPDQTDFFVSDNISLGHNRLSIIDLSEKARQPMRDEAGELVIIYNGEVYNFQELRADLEKKYKFKSESDTEVILYAYKEYGENCLNKLNGIFAFAIWDVRKGELFLARDRMGVKPLYYYFDGQRLIFSSEIKAILAHDVPREVDREAFNLYFQILYVPEPYTMFAGIKKLPAASYLKLVNNKLTIKTFWRANNFTNLTSKDEAEKEIRRLFQDSVKRQLISDRPVGVFLSGGIDSTAVLGAVREFTAERTKTFSVGFDTADSEKFNADFLLARETARLYGTDHHELVVTAHDILDNLEQIVWHLDEPNFNPTAGAIFLLAKEAKKDVAVVLGGDGGDELFGGYPRYYFSRWLSYYQSLPRSVRLLVKQALKLSKREAMETKLEVEPNAKRILAFLSLKDRLLSPLFKKGLIRSGDVYNYFTEKFFKNETFDKNDFEKHFMDIDRRSWLVDESLLRSDKMTMAWGLEERVPILDYRLVELANRLPTSWKINIWRGPPNNFQGKLIWKRAVSKYLLPHILSERKRGWFTPMAKWLRTKEMGDFVGEILSPSSLNGDFFRAEAMQKIWQEHLSGKQYNLNIIWAVVMWQLWYNRFIKK